MENQVKTSGKFSVECHGPDGRLKWREEIDNLVVNVGLDELLDKFFKGSAYTAAHYLGLKGAGSAAAGDTMASHAGWSEVTVYDEATRPAFTPGTVSSQSVGNAASKAVFTMNASFTAAGAFLTTNNTKGGTTGVLYSAGDFSGGSRSGGSGDTLTVEYTATAAAS